MNLDCENYVNSKVVSVCYNKTMSLVQMKYLKTIKEGVKF